jgi:hypothetical protein
MVLWVYGLAVGQGLTARFLKLPILSRYLAPLAYPVYVLHLPIAYFITYIWQGGTGYDGWMSLQGAQPVPLPSWGMFVVMIASSVLGFAFNEWVNPFLMPPTMAILRTLFTLICHCCSCRSKPEPTDTFLQQLDDEAQQNRVLQSVAEAVRHLTGAVITPMSRLDQVGLDSFGATALVGMLRSRGFVGLRPIDVLKMRTVQDLVLFLESRA